jgi:hypothetical protein
MMPSHFTGAIKELREIKDYPFEASGTKHYNSKITESSNYNISSFFSLLLGHFLASLVLCVS